MFCHLAIPGELMQILHFAVPGMSFDACVTDLTASLRRIPRVHLVSVDPWTESVVVTGRLLDERRLLAAISAAGYESPTHGRGGPVTYDALTKRMRQEAKVRAARRRP
jgi:copper chaperone CopZ